ncbi:MAG TPA: DUF6600 domain-containing protein [Candidatus Polarisedimenticolia bacterium]|jgi:hypothetical protein
MRTAKTLVIVLALALIAGSFSPPARADVSFSVAYSSLSPYGSWHVSGEYGRVWRPSVYRAGWNPYYDGHWEYTDLGWTWVSDYAWGGIPYHYGTWTLDPVYGWVWVPGSVWAPAWVVFCSGPDGMGWAPVPPGYSVGASISIHDVDPRRFVFVSSRDFLAPRVRSHVLPASRTKLIINKTRIINNIVMENNVVVNRGPDVQQVERATGHKVRRMPIERVPRAAPDRHVSREAIRSREALRAEPQKTDRGVRATEPVPQRTPLPSATAGKRAGRKPDAAPAKGTDGRKSKKHGQQTQQGKKKPAEGSGKTGA